jgi:hypothetical protein
VISGDIPWKEKSSVQICVEMSRGANSACPSNISDKYKNVIYKCWSWDPVGRPKIAEVIRFFARTNTTIFLTDPPLALAEDLTGRIDGTINDYIASGSFGNVYRCEWRRSSGPVKVWPVGSTGVTC